jgi:hypothetical protein
MSRIYSEILKSSSLGLLAKAVKLLSRICLAQKWDKRVRSPEEKNKTD